MDAPNIYLSIPVCRYVDIQITKLLIRLTSYFWEGDEKKTSLETGAGLPWRRVAASSRRCAGAFISGGTTPVTAGTLAININGQMALVRPPVTLFVNRHNKSGVRAPTCYYRGPAFAPGRHTFHTFHCLEYYYNIFSFLTFFTSYITDTCIFLHHTSLKS